jgi:hypothetical protein
MSVLGAGPLYLSIERDADPLPDAG